MLLPGRWIILFFRLPAQMIPWMRKEGGEGARKHQLVRYWTFLMMFTPYNQCSERRVFPLYRWGHWCSEKGLVQWACKGAKIEPQALWHTSLLSVYPTVLVKVWGKSPALSSEILVLFCSLAVALKRSPLWEVRLPLQPGPDRYCSVSWWDGLNLF